MPSILTPSDLELSRHTLNTLQEKIYQTNVKAGWYKDPRTGRKIDRNVPEMLALIHSEVSEALEGFRKNLMDTHLTNRPMVIVELADTLVRVFDLAGYLVQLQQGGVHIYSPKEPPSYLLGDAFVAKVLYNATREDHKPANRAKEGGKAF